MGCPEYGLGIPEEAELAAEVGSCPDDSMPVQKAVSDAARENGIAVVAQICTREGLPSGKKFLTVVAFDQEGVVRAKYHKIHLFPGAEPSSKFLVGPDDKEQNNPFCDLRMCDMSVRIGLIICYEMLGRLPMTRNEKRIGELKQGGAQLVLWSAGPTLTTIASKIKGYSTMRGLEKENRLPYSGWFDRSAAGAAQQVNIPVACCAALGAGLVYSHDGAKLHAEYDQPAQAGATGYTGRARVQIFSISIPTNVAT